MFLYLFFSFIFGLAIGSFLNCLIYRLAHEKSILGRSFCPKCGKTIAWYDNIPLLSFIVLKGRCRHCQEKISWQYPIVELATGLLFVVAFWRIFGIETIYEVGPRRLMLLVRDWIILATLLFIFVYDIKYLRIEDTVLLPAAGLVLILNWAVGYSLVGILIAILVAVAFFALQYFATRGKGLGLGDLRIGLFMGAALGNWPVLLVALLIAYVIGALVSSFLVFLGKKGFKSQIPLGPFLAVGTAIALFFGQQIINWYF